MTDNIEEAWIEEQPSPVDLNGTEVILSQMENCICQIVNLLLLELGIKIIIY